MKQQIHTIPVVIAYESEDECPFCHLERETDQRAIRYFAGPGASYMEPEIRGITNRTGFCNDHLQKLYDYGNPLGSALMLQSHYAGLLQELREQTENYEIPEKRGLFRRKKPEKTEEMPYWRQLQEKLAQCAICGQVADNMDRQYQVFFSLLKEEEFRGMIESSKGFCLRHFARLLQEARECLPQNQSEWFYRTVFALMEANMTRVKEDLDWFIAKYDYRNASAPWGNSRDALQRTMQKLGGLYPADPPYRNE